MCCSPARGMPRQPGVQNSRLSSLTASTQLSIYPLGSTTLAVVHFQRYRLSGNSNTPIMSQRPVGKKPKTSRQEGQVCTESKIQCAKVKDEGIVGRPGAAVDGWEEGGQREEMRMYSGLLCSQTLENRKSSDTWTTFRQCLTARARGQC